MELWDLYDENRVKLGKTMVRGEKQPAGVYRIVVHACIFNSQGQMLIQQRQPFKSGWSNMWDVTVGGSAVSGDTSCTAVERELFEFIRDLRARHEGIYVKYVFADSEAQYLINGNSNRV